MILKQLHARSQISINIGLMPKKCTVFGPWSTTGHTFSNVQQKKPKARSLVSNWPCKVAVGYVPLSAAWDWLQPVMRYYPSRIVKFFAEGTNFKDYSEIGKKATSMNVLKIVVLNDV